MSVLVTGGAGYIGSACVELLLENNFKVVVYDNLQKGHRTAVSPKADFVKGDLSDTALLHSVIRDFKITAVMHFAAVIEVGESVKNPSLYFQNNTINTKILLDSLLEYGVSKFIFSSTAAVYGEPHQIPMTEDHPTIPTNPYGTSKLCVEEMLKWYKQAYQLSYVSLRYFNASGATNNLGEDHHPETHLIPLILQTASGKRTHIDIYGQDYPTPDGTCIRDYIHIRDLSQAHLLALNALQNGYSGDVFNLGNGNGYSVREVIHAAEEVTGKSIPTREVPRRAGDPAQLIASSSKIRQILGWSPQNPELKSIVQSAWDWRQLHPNGYAD